MKSGCIGSDLKLQVCRKAFDEARGPCGKSIADVLGGIGDGLPDDAVQMLHELGTTDEDGSGEPHDNGDLLTAGINSTRGRAAGAITDLVIKDAAYVNRFAETVRLMIRDPSAPVRACVAATLYRIAQHNPGLGMSLFLSMDLSEDRLLTTRNVRKFIRWGLRDCFVELRPLVERMLRSPEPDVSQAGARWAGVAALWHEEAGALVDEAMRGGVRQRVGVAEVACANIGTQEYRSWCEAKLTVLFVDADAEVRREAASWCRQVPNESLGEFADLIATFGESKAFEDNPSDLLTALEELRGRLPGMVCRVCAKLFMRLADDARDSRTRPFADAYTVSKLIFRTYQQHPDDEWTERTLDLIDLLCLEGTAGAGDEFERFER